MRKKKHRILRERAGTTLVETLVSLLLMSILIGMAARVLSGAYRVYLRLQKTQYAESILDTAMTEVRDLANDACGYVKLYPDGAQIAGQVGNETGTAMEFLDSNGYVVLISTDGCEETTLYRGNDLENVIGTQEALPKGRLLARYYNRKNDGTYLYTDGTKPVARAAAEAYGEGFYMGYYLKVTYRVPDETADGGALSSLVADVALYQDENCTELVISDTEILDFRYKIKYSEGVTATTVMNNTP